MTEFRLTISLDNAAFDDPGELPRILTEMSDDVDGVRGWRATRPYGSVRDINGNTVGDWVIEP